MYGLPCFSYSAPFYTKEEEEREIADLTPAEKEDILDDLYGRNVEQLAALADETISDSKIAEFNDALENIPLDERQSYGEALEQCPDLLSTESNPKYFLHSENYNPELAALRMTKYWNMRVNVFKEKAFLPMTLEGAMSDDIESMQSVQHLWEWIPKDDYGRAVLCSDRTTHYALNFDRGSQVRILWYMMHVALENESARKHGMVLILVRRKENSNPQFDRIKSKQTMKILANLFPMRLCAIHMITEASSIASLEEYSLPALKVFMGRRIRTRFKLHVSTSETSVLEGLVEYGLRKRNLPQSIGGCYIGSGSDADWIQQRREVEEDNIVE